jgi:8-oxo-dGTP diphosphatase
MPEKTVICVDLKGKEYVTPVSELSWRPSAYGVVIKDGALLLSKQFDGYDLPGGGVDLGEMLEDAVIRETNEETGIEVTNPRLIGGTSNFFKHAHSDGHSSQSILLYYVCDFVGGEFSIAGFDEDEKKYADMPEWIPLTELESIKVASSFDWRDLVIKHAQTL